MGRSRDQERGNNREVVMVAVDAGKEITDYALEWAVRNVIRATSSIILLALLPSTNPPIANRNHQSQIHKFLACLLKKWGLQDGEKSTQTANSKRGKRVTHKINEVCEQMMKQLCAANNFRQVKTQVKIIENSQRGSVAMEAKELGATWVVLDRRLKNEGDFCLEQVKSNVIVIDHAIPKILRLNLKPEDLDSEEITGSSLSRIVGGLSDFEKLKGDPTVANILGVYPVYLDSSANETPPSSLGLDSPTRKTDPSCSFSSPDPGQRTMPSRKSEGKIYLDSLQRIPKYHLASVKDSNWVNTREKPPKVPTPTRRSTDSTRSLHGSSSRSPTKARSERTRRSFKDQTRPRIKTEIQASALESPSPRLIDRTSSIRRAISLSIKQPPTPPPLCSMCKHSSPIFGKPPRKFSYKEMEKATDGFSRANFLAEGGYGPVYRGVLPDGQVVAVKQHKVVSAQGASEFCSEVEVLSCAQHRNLVMLIGYCMDEEWLLVYEFACNGSLDKHLYGGVGKDGKEVLAWEYRQKVAIGAARGLRYLHEDCRVGCIVHRDLRPNNILLTHDFEAMVGDFGLARWQADGQSAEETRIIGTFGYLAPEYTQTGQITEKADVYSFGVLLLELLTGQKAIDLSRDHGQQYLPEWARPLLEKRRIDKLIDPRLDGNYSSNEVQRMMFSANLCISLASETRPRMSKVLRILEGDMPSGCMQIASSPSENNSRRTSFGADRSLRKIWSINSNQTDETLDGPLHVCPSQLQYQFLKPKLAPAVVERIPRSNNDSHLKKYKHGSFEVYNAGHDTEGPSSSWSLNQNELEMNEEYQAYLKGSLANFIQKVNDRSHGSSTTLTLSDYGYPSIPPQSKRSP